MLKTNYDSEIWALADMQGTFIVDKPNYSVVEYGAYTIATFGNYRTGGTLVIQFKHKGMYTTTVYKIVGPNYEDIRLINHEYKHLKEED